MAMIIACAPKKQETAQTKKSFNDFLIAYFNERMQLYPMEATQNGDNRFNDILPNDITESYRTKLRDFYGHYRQELTTFDRASLSTQEQVSYDIFAREM